MYDGKNRCFYLPEWGNRETSHRIKTLSTTAQKMKLSTLDEPIVKQNLSKI